MTSDEWVAAMIAKHGGLDAIAARWSDDACAIGAEVLSQAPAAAPGADDLARRTGEGRQAPLMKPVFS